DYYCYSTDSNTNLGLF
nr:immunoglobulin light chain junction region [Macaca mulatta]MOW15513.1 immunoglobulin light chain junction region [Macaca mulatta]MOW15727.1 immunoglobulin light chain junction region [Macaca mulatta]MOW16672.1 immunoglobulin light chain junction region [Macaca mulatta]MOW16878.1 immunoglobulin light chain junction region [Macaca mulatta]